MLCKTEDVYKQSVENTVLLTFTYRAIWPTESYGTFTGKAVSLYFTLNLRFAHIHVNILFADKRSAGTTVLTGGLVTRSSLSRS